MKNLMTFLLVFSLSPQLSAQFRPEEAEEMEAPARYEENPNDAEFAECGADYICYHKKKAEMKERRQQRQEAEQNSYRRKQLRLEEEQLRRIENQNELLRDIYEKDTPSSQKKSEADS